MAHLVLATHAARAHVNPMVPLVRELIRRGHEVSWYTGPAYRGTVEEAGARYLPPRRGTFVDFDRMELDNPQIVAMAPVARRAWFLEHVWADTCEGQFHDLAAEFQRDPGSILLADSGMWAANLLHEVHGVVWATISQSPMSIPDPELPPFGKGWHPAPPGGTRRRDDVAGRNAFAATFGRVEIQMSRLRSRLGLPPARGQRVTPYLFLQASVPSFEYPRRRVAPQVHFVGALIPKPTRPHLLPAWYAELDTDRPVILVTQGTTARGRGVLMSRAIEAFAETDALVVVTTGGPGTEVGSEQLPSNVRVASFVPYHELLPKVDVVVCNGGYGTVQQALTHALPLVVSGRLDDKPEVCGRVSWCGAGIDLRTEQPSPVVLLRAVDAILTEPHFRQAALRMANEYARHDAPREAAALIGRLAEERAPIVRPVLARGYSTAVRPR
ncbi:glycosyltransferase [Nocardia acidivorans]|uniref:glycosyltransferase n=1 Tax=Nocardia acidivorans TaxID=404580 RepID=UPI0008367F2B|nr:nucleotide disphospho-sugar-binding domain-containing protein [Nocardia acidivorans]